MSIRSRWLPLAAALSLVAGTVPAQLINVDFNTNSSALGSGGPAIGPTMLGGAVLGAAGDRWNGIEVTSGTAIPLFYFNGSSSPVTLSFTSGGGYDVNSYGGATPFASTPYDALMEDYLYSGGVPQSIAFSGLVPRSPYDLVLYNAADGNGAGRTTFFTVATNMQSSTWNGSSNTLIEGVNYVEFKSALADRSGNLVVTWSGNGSAEGDLDGCQIQPHPGPAAPGLDPTFAGSGKTLIGFDAAQSAAYAVAIQADGRIVVGGATNNESGNSGLALARLNPNGALDLSFGVNGKVTTPDVDNASALAIQPDGKILVAGGFSGFELARYNTNGSLDTAFGSNGIAKALGPSTAAQAVGIQADGKIVVSGHSQPSGPEEFAIARFNTNGTPDGAFGNAGTVLTLLETAAVGYGGGIQPDGKSLLAGIAVSENGASTAADFAVVRYNTNGALDLTFGSLGRATNNAGGGTLDGAYAMAVQPDGKIVLAGAAGLGSFPGPLTANAVVNALVALTRLNTNGTPDTTFGNNGTVLTEVGAFSDYALAVALQPDGKILVAGASAKGNYEWFIQRYQPNGTIDPTYGANGVRFVDFGSGTNEFANAMALDSSGRAVVAGDAGGVFGVARLLPEAAPVSLKISLTSTNTALVSWPYPSAGWNLQQTGNLQTANWVTPPGTIGNDGTNNFMTITLPAGNLFFRLAQP